MKVRRVLQAALVVALLAVAAVASPEPADATSGTWWVTANTTLSQDHRGQIVIAADGVTLDCAGHASLRGLAAACRPRDC